MRWCCCSSTSTGRCCCVRAPSTRAALREALAAVYGVATRLSGCRRRRAHRHGDRTRPRRARRRRRRALRRRPRGFRPRARRGLRRALPAVRSPTTSHRGCTELLDRARGARRRALLARDRQLRAGRAAQARARRHRPPLRAGQGGFGSDAEDRDELPPIARARAGGYPRERTIVIGDTPLDIACARADGVRVLAVATGIFAADELSDADAVVRRRASSSPSCSSASSR